MSPLVERVPASVQSPTDREKERQKNTEREKEKRDKVANLIALGFPASVLIYYNDS